MNHRAEESFRFVRLGVINAYTILQILSFAVVFTVSRSTDFDKNTVLPVATFYPFLVHIDNCFSRRTFYLYSSRRRI